MRAFFSALAFLTVIPVPAALKSTRENAMFPAYPAAGLLIGCVLSAVFGAAGLVFPLQLAAVVLVGGSLALTGAIHLDGLADCADAFYGRRDRESTLRILKDPRIGTMGGAAIGLSLLARYAAVTTTPAPAVLLALPLLSAFSRTMVLGALTFLPYVRESGGIISASPARRAVMPVLAVAAAVVMGALLPVPTAGALLALACLWRVSWKKTGGCTGDVLGASIEIAEIVFLVLLAGQSHLHASVGAFYPLASLVSF